MAAAAKAQLDSHPGGFKYVSGVDMKSPPGARLQSNAAGIVEDGFCRKDEATDPPSPARAAMIAHGLKSTSCITTAVEQG
mmetsp:Transcript_9236/g.14784  ORF Transcript_9236/g.14784 Transcript_9236/m.14784 type:complete len:80 (+) Transcript_9236:432-671(+)